MGGVGRIKEGEMRSEIIKKGRKISRGESRRRRRGVSRGFNKIKITANKSSNVIRHSKHGLNKFRVEGKISRFKVDIKNLKRGVGRRSRGIAAKLNVTGSKRREGIIRATKVTRKGRGVNNNSAGMITIKLLRETIQL